MHKAASIDELRDYLDPATVGMSENTYLEVYDERAMGSRRPLRRAPSDPTGLGREQPIASARHVPAPGGPSGNALHPPIARRNDRR